MLSDIYLFPGPVKSLAKLAGDGAAAERPLCGMQRGVCPVNKGALQAQRRKATIVN